MLDAAKDELRAAILGGGAARLAKLIRDPQTPGELFVACFKLAADRVGLPPQTRHDLALESGGDTVPPVLVVFKHHNPEAPGDPALPPARQPELLGSRKVDHVGVKIDGEDNGRGAAPWVMGPEADGSTTPPPSWSAGPTAAPAPRPPDVVPEDIERWMQQDDED
jgi:hypothetical protein